MTRNPHEIVTLDDQPDNGELCLCGHGPDDHVDQKHGCLETRASDDNICPCLRYRGQRYDDGEGYELGRAYGSPKPVDNQPDDFDSGYRCQWCGEPEGHIDDCPQLLVEKLSARIETLKQPTSKPMRIRYMELPGEINPNTNELTTPFVIVIDRVTGGPLDLETGNAIALNTGARGILAFEQEIQIGDDPE